MHLSSMLSSFIFPLHHPKILHTPIYKIRETARGKRNSTSGKVVLHNRGRPRLGYMHRIPDIQTAEVFAGLSEVPLFSSQPALSFRSLPESVWLRIPRWCIGRSEILFQSNYERVVIERGRQVSKPSTCWQETPCRWPGCCSRTRRLGRWVGYGRRSCGSRSQGARWAGL